MKFYAVLTLIMLLLCAPLSFATNEVTSKVHLTTHEIEMSTVLDDTACSATAIGPYAILTASHCEAASNELTVDEDTPAKIVGIVRDGNDHSIYFLNMEKPFSAWSAVADTLPEVGEAVFMFGNPGKLTDVYRQGYVAQIKTKKAMSIEELLSGKPSPTVVYYDMIGMEGDSGSGIFDAHTGEIIGVLTGEVKQGNVEHGFFILSAGYQLAFSRGDLKQAATYAPPVQKK